MNYDPTEFSERVLKTWKAERWIDWSKIKHFISEFSSTRARTHVRRSEDSSQKSVLFHLLGSGVNSGHHRIHSLLLCQLNRHTSPLVVFC